MTKNRFARNIIPIDKYLDGWSIKNKATAIWSFNEISGITANDLLDRTTCDLTANGAPAWTAGLLGNCTQLDGASTMAWYCANSPDFHVGYGDFTFCAWVYATRNTGNPQVICAKDRYGTSSDWLGVSIEQTNGYGLYLGTTFRRQMGVAFPINQWVFVWAKREDDVCSGGYTVASAGAFTQTPHFTWSEGGSLGVNDGYWVIGNQQSASGTTFRSDRGFAGKIDQTLWFNGTALSTKELESLYNYGAGTELLESNPDYWDIWQKQIYSWGFDEASGTVAYDITRQNNLTGYNSPSWYTTGGKINGATVLDGTTYWYYPTVSYSPLQPNTRDFTFCGWFWISNPINDQTFFSKMRTTDATNRMAIVFTGGQRIYCYLGDTVFNTTDQFPANQWVFFWLRKRGQQVTLGWTVDTTGQFSPTARASANVTTTIQNTVDQWRLGSVTAAAGGATATWPLQGMIDQIIWCKGYAFSDVELAALYNSGVGTSAFKGFLSSTNPVVIEKNEIYRITTESKLYVSTPYGHQVLNGGIKIGELQGHYNAQTRSAGYLYCTRFTATCDAVLNYLGVNIYAKTDADNPRVVLGIYDDWGSQNYPHARIGNTAEYTVKESDQQSCVLIPLQKPVQIYKGQRYWLAYMANTNINGWCLSSDTTGVMEKYWSTPYSGIAAGTYSCILPSVIYTAATSTFSGQAMVGI